MSDEKKKLKDISKKSIDMLLNSTFKRHGVKIDKPKDLSKKEKQEIRELIKDLKESVKSLTKKEKK